MMRVKDALKEELACVLKADTKKGAIEELISLLKASGRVRDINALKQNILHREQLMSTGIGLGLAVPHTRMEGVRSPVMAVGVSPKGIRDYESIDGEEVRIVALIVCGSRQHKEYISLLSSIVNALKDGSLKKDLCRAKTGKEIFKRLAGEK